MLARKRDIAPLALPQHSLRALRVRRTLVAAGAPPRDAVSRAGGRAASPPQPDPSKGRDGRDVTEGT